MKRLLCAVVFGISGLASAGELEDANKLLTAKAYDKAFPIYAKLAAAGNTEAQFRLGEMYWYGDGTAVDMRAATDWMQKAAARGHAGAVESLAILRERETRAADIAYWTTSYKGEDLVSGKYNCPAPVIPELSRTTAEIKATSDAYAKWQACYNGFVADINGPMAPGRRIPADIAKLMTPRETEQAAVRLNDVYSSVINASQDTATRVVTQYSNWQGATERIVAIDNQARRLEYDVLKRQAEEANIQRANAYPKMNVPQPMPSPPAGGK